MLLRWPPASASLPSPPVIVVGTESPVKIGGVAESSTPAVMRSAMSPASMNALVTPGARDIRVGPGASACRVASPSVVRCRRCVIVTVPAGASTNVALLILPGVAV